MTRWERLGGALFRARSATPVALLAVALLWPSDRSLTAGRLTAAALGVAAGEAVRIWAVGVAGKRTRTRGTKVKTLVTSGPFALVRNPLYIGNFLLAVGVAAFSGVTWLLWALPPLFSLQYGAIVAWEERVLTEAFGEEYGRYRARVGRWLPRPAPPVAPGGPAWSARTAWQSERDTLVGLAAVLAVLLAKQTVFHDAHTRAVTAALRALGGSG